MPEEFEVNDQSLLAESDYEMLARQLQETLDRNTRLFDAMLAHSRDGILLTGPDGRIVRIVRSLAGYGPIELAGMLLDTIIHPDDHEKLRACYRRLVSRMSASEEIEVRAMRIDGSYIWVDATITDMLDVPDVQAIVCNYSDMTRRKEQELKAAEFEAIVRNSEYAIFSKDVDGNIVTWNHGAEKVFGWGGEEVVGRHVHVLVPEDLREEERNIRQHACETGETVEVCTERLHKDGSRVSIELQLSPVRNHDGQIWRLIHISRRAR